MMNSDMKKQIRQAVFETNSSSVHSISIIKDDFKGSLPKQFTIDCDGEFGWEVDAFDDSSSKAAYLYQAIVHYPTLHFKEKSDVNIYKEKLQDLMNKFIGNLESYGIEVDCKYKFVKIRSEELNYCDDYNYDYVVFVDENGYESEYGGYLDHGGEAKELVDYVLSSPENTIKFIFDNRCYIETGNDNEGCYGDSKYRNYGESIIFEKGN